MGYCYCHHNMKSLIECCIVELNLMRVELKKEKVKSDTSSSDSSWADICYLDKNCPWLTTNNAIHLNQQNLFLPTKKKTEFIPKEVIGRL